jgi:Protein of unknown function (DUF3263)
VPSDGGLSERDRTVVPFERRRWKYAAEDSAIRAEFGLSATRVLSRR